MPDTDKCPLCNRELAEPIVRHHLIPPSKGGKDSPTVPMHKICQAKVHAVFTETELKTYYNTVDRLKEHEDIAKFIKWVSKKELEFFDTTIKKKQLIFYFSATTRPLVDVASIIISLRFLKMQLYISVDFRSNVTVLTATCVY